MMVPPPGRHFSVQSNQRGDFSYFHQFEHEILSPDPLSYGGIEIEAYIFRDIWAPATGCVCVQGDKLDSSYRVGEKGGGGLDPLEHVTHLYTLQHRCCGLPELTVRWGEFERKRVPSKIQIYTETDFLAVLADILVQSIRQQKY